MGVVSEMLLKAETRPKVIGDCVQLVDDEVNAKTGVSGMVIKTGYKAFKAMKPSIVKNAVEFLLDDFVHVIDHHYAEYEGSSQNKDLPFDSWAIRRNTHIANDMLGVTDRLIDKSDKIAIKKIYRGLRGVAERNVALAVPGVARVVLKYIK